MQGPGVAMHVVCVQGGSDGGKESIGKGFTVRGWVRTVRKQKAFSFIEVLTML